MDLFSRAKEIGLNTVTSWLPGGKREGSEWVCKNPTRFDRKAGSFKVNLITGQWAEFNGGEDRGNDVVSLYAYVYRDHLHTRAVEGKYKNIDSGVQTEAAKEILQKYDMSYIPGSYSIESKKGYWDGFHPELKGVDNPPALDVSWFEKKPEFGPLEKVWDFKRYVGKDKIHIVLKVARFRNAEGKKNDRPFTLWTDGKEYRWRAKQAFPQGEIPLYNEYLLEERPNDEVFLSEGQKCAEAAAQAVGDQFVCVGWYAGAGNFNKSKLDHLIGRSGPFWPDGDMAGRKVIVKLKDIEFKYRLVRSLPGKPKGWDVADAIEEGLDILEMINNEDPERDLDAEYFEDWNPPFRIVGTTAKNIYFYTKETKQLIDYKKSSLGKPQLLTLMDRDLWGVQFSKTEGGIAWDTATNFLLRRASLRPIFVNTLIRGSGAWIDSGRVVINTGEKILCEGKEYDLFDFESKYVYEKTQRMPYSTDLPNSTNRTLLDLCKSLEWVRPEFAYMLTGWLLLAPFGGSLDWRPHVWLNGPKGAGKTWTIQNIVTRILNPFAVNALGSSTAAGVRQAIGKSTRPFVCDEMEGDDKRQAELIQDKLTMARQSSSGSENSGSVLQGTADGDGTEYRYQSMWMAASIGVTLRHGADADRWSLLTLANPKRVKQDIRAEKFKALEKKAEIITPVWVEGLHSRTLKIINEIQEAIEIFVLQTAAITGTRRSGDQIGTLMAGAYMSYNDKAPSAAEAAAWLQEFDLAAIADDSDRGDDEREVLDYILSYQIDYDREKFSIGSLLLGWFESSRPGNFNLEQEAEDREILNQTQLREIKKRLTEYGIKPIQKGNGYIQIAIQHPAIRQILKETPWPESYGDLLGQLDYCGPIEGPCRFGGIQKRYRKIEASEALGYIPF